MPFVVDASVTLAWGLRDEATAYADAVLDRVPHDTAWAPAIWVLEVTNVILVSERRDRITVARSAAFLQELGALQIQIDAVEPSVVWIPTLALARAQDLTVYDASYIELALRTGLPLATQDNRLRAVAGGLGVPIFLPEPLSQSPNPSSPNGV